MIPDPKSLEPATRPVPLVLDDFQSFDNDWYFGLRDEITETLPVDGDEIEEVKV